MAEFPGVGNAQTHRNPGYATLDSFKILRMGKTSHVHGLEDLVGLKLNIQKTKIMASGPITSWEIDGEKVETVSGFIFFGAPKSLQMVTAAMKLKDAYSLEGKL